MPGRITYNKNVKGVILVKGQGNSEKVILEYLAEAGDSLIIPITDLVFMLCTQQSYIVVVYSCELYSILVMGVLSKQ